MSRLRTALLAFGVSALLCGGLAFAPAAHANAILVTSQPGEADGTGRRIRPDVPVRPAVTLEQHRVTALLRDSVAEVTVEQVFRNHSNMQLEGTYLFPLPEGAAVSRWAMTMGGKMVEGEILEAGQARAIYESIVRRRRDPGLLEYMGRGLFQARVFPIEPRGETTIRLVYQQVLPEDGGTIEFRYPLGTERLNASPVASVVVDVRVESSVDVKAIYSPTHALEVLRDGDRKARIGYERQGERQERDLVLYVGRSESALGFTAQSHRAPGEDGTFMLVLAPRAQPDASEVVPKDVVFVLDTSGSMAGPKLEQARKALAYGIRMLRPEDRFNVLGFATGLHPFRDALQPASSEMKEAAVAWVGALSALGGTNIHGALLGALAMRAEGRLFHVVFVTDGKPTIEVTDPDQIVAKVKAANSSSTRIFTFGVGYDLDVNLLDRIAESTRAARDYVRPDEDIEIVTGRFFRKVEQPVLSNVSIVYGAGVAEVYPREFPDVFAGGQIVVFGRYSQPGERTIRLEGKVGARTATFEHRVNFQAGEGAGWLPRLWAQRKIAYLLDEIRLHGANPELVDEVVRLATKYAIVTPYTAGLVVEEGELDGRAMPGEARPRGERTLGGLIPQGRAAGGSGPPPASAPAGERAQDDSKNLDALKEGGVGAADDAGAFARDDSERKALREVASRVRHVAGRTFRIDGEGRWIDASWKVEQTPVRIEAFSEAYFALLARHAAVADILALGERIVFVHEGAAYEIVLAP